MNFLVTDLVLKGPPLILLCRIISVECPINLNFPLLTTNQNTGRSKQPISVKNLLGILLKLFGKAKLKGLYHALGKFKMKMGAADTFFEPHLWNSGNLLLFSRCKNHITIIFLFILLFKSCKKCWSLPLQVFRALWVI